MIVPGLAGILVLRRRLGLVRVLAVAAVPMSENVHQGTRGEQQIGQDSEEVRAVLGDKEKGRDQSEADEHNFPEAIRRLALTAVMIHVDVPCGLVQRDVLESGELKKKVVVSRGSPGIRISTSI